MHTPVERTTSNRLLSPHTRPRRASDPAAYASSPLNLARTACVYISGCLLAAMCLVWLGAIAATTAAALWKRRATLWSRHKVEPGKFADNGFDDLPAAAGDRYVGYRVVYVVSVVTWAMVQVGINWAYPNVAQRYDARHPTCLGPRLKMHERHPR